MKIARKKALTHDVGMILYCQQTRQASVLRGTLNSGGFLFAREKKKTEIFTVDNQCVPRHSDINNTRQASGLRPCSNRRVTLFRGKP